MVAVALHGRTAAQAYSGDADWAAIRLLKQTVTTVPVLGNGDIWSAEDALRMVAETGCDGVVVGRGCLGRPWLFTDLAAAFAGTSARVTPTLGEVDRHAAPARAHTCATSTVSRSAPAATSASTSPGTSRVSRPARRCASSLALVDSLASLDELLATLDPDAPWPGEAAEGQRGRAGSSRTVALPDGGSSRASSPKAHRRTIAEAELSVSGG